MALDQYNLKYQNDFNEENASSKLFEIGLDSNIENIETVIKLMECNQHPQGYDEIFKNLENPVRLKEIMKSKGINLIIHSEGPSLWDHVNNAIKMIEKMDLSPSDKKKLKLLILYHDLGKTEVWNNKENIESTIKNLTKGKLFSSMRGHAEAQLDAIKKGFQANEIKDKELDLFMKIVLNHMVLHLQEQPPQTIVSIVNQFGTNEQERKQALKLFCIVLELDSNTSETIKIDEDGNLLYSKKMKRKEIDFNAVWAKYQEGLNITNKN